MAPNPLLFAISNAVMVLEAFTTGDDGDKENPFDVDDNDKTASIIAVVDLIICIDWSRKCCCGRCGWGYNYIISLLFMSLLLSLSMLMSLPVGFLNVKSFF